MAKARSNTAAGSHGSPGTPERRRAARKRVLWTGRVEVDQHLVHCAVVDVSLQGARVRLDEGALPQGPLAINVSHFGTFQAEVVWRDERVAGLRFLESIDRVADTIGRQLPLAMVA